MGRQPQAPEAGSVSLSHGPAWGPQGASLICKPDHCNFVYNYERYSKILTNIYKIIQHVQYNDDIASYCSIFLNTLFNVLHKSTQAYAGFSTIVSLLCQGALQNSPCAALPGSIITYASSGHFLNSLLSDLSPSEQLLRVAIAGCHESLVFPI